MVNDKMVNVMKNEVNRAFMAKKRIYNQPEVQVAQFASMTLMLGTSPTINMDINDIPSEQW